MSINILAAQNLEGKDSIRSAIKELETFGYLTRGQENEGRFGEAIWYTSDPSENPMTENPTTVNPTTKNNILKEDQLTKKLPQAELEGEFEEFWSIYPRKVDKLAARKAYAKAVGEFGSTTVLAGARRMANDPNLPPKQFIPYPATWLNAGGWDSEPYPERERTAEEKQAIAKAEAERRRAVELEHMQKLRAEQEEAKRHSAPPPKCPHGKSIVSCRACLRQQ